MNKIKLTILFILCIFYNINSQITNNGQNAPTATISSAVACPNTIITLHVTATNVVCVNGIGLWLNYDGAVLSYIDPNPNQLLGNFHNTDTILYNTGGDFIVNQVTPGFNPPGMKLLVLAWMVYYSNLNSIIIPATNNNIANILDLTFRYYGGNTTISFNNSYGGGQMCEWTDNSNNGNNAYIDTPTEYFYQNGVVTECMNYINKVERNKEISIYPNPAKEVLNIDNAEEGEVVIYNLLGEAVLRTKSKKGGSTINVAGLPIGSYIVKLVMSSGVVVKQLIIVD